MEANPSSPGTMAPSPSASNTIAPQRKSSPVTEQDRWKQDQLLWAQAQQAIRTERWNPAIGHLEHYLTEFPAGDHLFDALLDLGRAHSELKEWSKAAKHLEAFVLYYRTRPLVRKAQAIALPRVAMGYLRWARALRNLDLPAEALAACENWPQGIPLKFHVERLILQAEIAGSLHRKDLAEKRLSEAEHLVMTRVGAGLSATDADVLRPEVQRARISNLKQQCDQDRAPTTFQEDRWDADITEYFRCLEPARIWVCSSPTSAVIASYRSALQAMIFVSLVEKHPSSKQKEWMDWTLSLIQKKSALFRNAEPCALPEE